MMSGHSDEIDGFVEDHPDVDDLIGYVRGELTQQQARQLRAHAARCLDCGDQLAALILLREERLTSEEHVAAPVTATVMPFPTAAPAPARRWPLAAAAAAMLIVALAWFTWPVQVAELGAAVADGPRLPVLEFEATDADIRQVLRAVDFLALEVGGGAQTATDRAPDDRTLIAEALQPIGRGDLIAARTLLEPFAARWELDGTALLGQVLFLLEDPTAVQVLEMYAADHPRQTWVAEATSPEALAFFFLARLRHVAGDDIGARNAVGWIHPRIGAGPAAIKWLQETLGDPAAGDPPSIEP